MNSTLFINGDTETLIAAMEENARENPDKILDVQHILEDGDCVAVHSRVRFSPDHLGIATVHLFRFKNNLIIDLWDIG